MSKVLTTTGAIRAFVTLICATSVHFLSGVGRLVVKDSIMLGAAFLTMTDAARESLR